MQQLINRILNALSGFLIGAFRQPGPGDKLPPPKFPVGTPPTPPPLPVVVPPTAPPPNANMAALIAEFVAYWNGRFVPPKFGGDYQCVALVNEYVTEIGEGLFPRLAAAGDFVYRNIPGFVFIANTPTNHPNPGDIVEWGKSPTLQWGHIGVCHHADIMHLTTFDQNWPLHSPAHLQSHTYVGVTGWHRPLNPKDQIPVRPPGRAL